MVYCVKNLALWFINKKRKPFTHEQTLKAKFLLFMYKRFSFYKEILNAHVRDSHALKKCKIQKKNSLWRPIKITKTSHLSIHMWILHPNTIPTWTITIRQHQINIKCNITTTTTKYNKIKFWFYSKKNERSKNTKQDVIWK